MEGQRRAITLGSLNLKGFSREKVDYLKNLLNNRVDILLVQEHWLFDDDIASIADEIGGVNVYGVSGMPSDKLVHGRRYGGCAVIIRASLDCVIEPITNIHVNRRLFSFFMSFPCGFKCIVHNVYMPCDTEYDNDNLLEYMNVLYDIDTVNACKSDVEHVVIGGDFNTDTSRDRSLHTPALIEYCDSRSFQLSCQSDMFSIDYTFVSDVTQSTSLIDHFACSVDVMSLVTSGNVVHDGHILSDHHPIIMTLDIQGSLTLKAERIFSPKPRWQRANAGHLTAYSTELCRALRVVDPPFEALACRNRRCTEHFQSISRYYDQLMDACEKSARQTIPNGKSKQKAGWNSYVRPYQEQAKFWFQIWHQNGRPKQGIVRDLMHSTKAEYKRLSKWVIRNQDKLQSEKMADALSNSSCRDFWDEVQRKKHGGRTVPASIEGVHGDAGICDMFAKKYDDLYNSVPFNVDEMDELCNHIDSLIDSKCRSNMCYSDHNVCVPDVIKAVRQLKRGKGEAYEGVSSDHIVNACFELFVHLSFLFNAMIVHQTAPSGMLISALVPIPKDKRKSLSMSDNYRSIALSSIVGKVLDKIILTKHLDVLSTSNLQFGFKNGHSTTQCTFVLEEVINEYSNNDSLVYCVLLDASKAFDRLHYVKLFYLLLSKGFCPTLCKLLISMYTQQQLVVKWNGSVSTSLRCSNGVKQGGVLSPTLFCIYMDELISSLRSSQIGCHIGNLYAGALAYADDLTLLAPNLRAIQKMLSICEQFAEEYSVLYNPKKSVLLIEGRGANDINVGISLNGIPIRREDSCKHLGVEIGVNSNKLNVNRLAHDLIRRTNLILSNYGHCDWRVLRKLFLSYCSHAYGCPLWNLDKNAVLYFITAWKKCSRKIIGVSPLTRSKYIPRLMSSKDVLFQLNVRCLNFFLQCLKSNNAVVQLASRRCANGYSIAGFNVRRLLALLGVHDISFFELFDHSTLVHKLQNALCIELSDEELCHVMLIEELLDARDSVAAVGLDHFEINALLTYVCVDT